MNAIKFSKNMTHDINLHTCSYEMLHMTLVQRCGKPNSRSICDLNTRRAFFIAIELSATLAPALHFITRIYDKFT
jgi:hypothetical protein